MTQIQQKAEASLPEFAGDESSSLHQHDHSSTAHRLEPGDTTGPRLLITLAINLLIPAAQIIGGIYAQSMALISDDVHNFSDFTAILVA